MMSTYLVKVYHYSREVSNWDGALDHAPLLPFFQLLHINAYLVIVPADTKHRLL